MADEKKSTFKDKLHAFGIVVKKIAKRVWAYLKVAKMEWIVMISLFAFDLISKAIVDAVIDVGDTVVVIPYFLNFHNTHNHNAAFGSSWIKSWFGPLGARIFFCVFAVAASVIFVMVLIKQKGKSKLFRVALAMLVAGAMGNCMDRWALGYVRDFVEFVYFGLTIAGSKSFYIFNIADAELVIGVGLIIIYFLFFYRDKNDEKKREARLAKKQAKAAAKAGVAIPAEEAAETAQAVETTETAVAQDPPTEEAAQVQAQETAQATTEEAAQENAEATDTTQTAEVEDISAQAEENKSEVAS